MYTLASSTSANVTPLLGINSGLFINPPVMAITTALAQEMPKARIKNNFKRRFSISILSFS
jgi:hypothetical protein